MTSLTRAELVQLAQTNLKDLAYLGNVSGHLLPAVDVACIIDQAVLPAHSYVLMAASPVFAELVAAYFARVVKGDHQPEVVTVPRPDTTAEAVMTNSLQALPTSGTSRPCLRQLMCSYRTHCVKSVNLQQQPMTIQGEMPS